MVGHAVALAKQLGTSLRVASFGVRNATMYPPEVGLTAEDSVLDSWSGQAAAGAAAAGRRGDHRRRRAVR